MNEQTYQAISMIIYFVAMIVIGLWAYQRTDDMDDYMLAGRNLGPLSTALSAGASDMSGWLLMGLPGAFYLSGMSTMWLPIGLTVGAWLNWKYTAPRLRTYTEVADNSLTIPTFLSARLHDGSRLIQIGAGVIILVFFTFYVSSGMVAGGRFFEASFGVDYRLGMVLVAGITVLYTLVGGFLAVAYTDVVQGLMMVTALVAVPVAGLFRLGGPDSLISTINELDPGTWALWGASTSLMSIVSAAAWGLGYFGQPHIIVRFMALETPQQAKAGRRIGIGWMALACLGAAATALVGIATYRRDTGQLPNPETVFIALGQLLFHPFVAGFMLAAILAAIMSTISSQLLVSSSALVEDLYHAFNRKELGEKRSVLLGRVAVMIVSVVAALMAWQADDSILKLVSFAWAGFGASFGPVVLLALFWRRLTRWGALAGMTTGAVVAAVWANLSGGIFDLYELLPGFVANLIVTIVVSLSTEVAPGVDAEFDEAVALVADFRKGELTTSVEN
ncbi:sodium/proline symporter PutP [Arachnia propionica]|uniref:Sodium/proline symporter n=1 Tax=Arachnia propionica TaxID=1750 RepID=A0AB37HXP1_9ACTN|nr:sodium/proline symporter PutP [Arachnia propionica]AFN45510.1 sodium/proline symporter [Arachnia propionica F0230a]QCT38229.1 sodium/proline symporter PutP [Arachnia propionica]QUC12186.1 sodium/proline symporter PutP [Arachnia propionica]QUC13139.1 sodium/proline symporter PutP [Arachnia propionica]RPA18988.1 sodium/proline symporter PutP [Arachnia propionica]